MTEPFTILLLSSTPVAKSLLTRKRRPQRRNLVAKLLQAGAELIEFPPSRDTRLVADLTRVFLDLRESYGRRCRSMLLARRFKPIAARLRRMGVPAAAIERELGQLEAAVARLVWIADGRPSYGIGGGSAA
ncbi:hypothetical protein FV222_02480 [Methylobacterium sp. WL103]|uniref:hypothetical protein n=1 Tax=Methylobacterium sp. WL103 TaxID=2603891 RepID=UPI0011CA228C|nr:hypothetical protein [Methylobacterium sp. WL103]TXN07387.1 hypothetical protein FV222_02480 [Methylobacterium sp. WL103]